MKRLVLSLLAPLFLMAPGALGAPSGQITADPSVFTLVAPEATFSTRLSWTTRDDSGGWVTLTAGEGEEQLVAQGGSNAGMDVSGLGAGRTLFRLYGDEALTQLLDSIETAGTVSPLTVHSDGTLRLDNRPFTGVGVNYYSAFERVLEKSSDTSYAAGFEALSRWGVPFARLDVSGYWPSKTRMFFTNRTEYLQRLDGVVASAERHGVGLIPSLFWTTFTFPDLAGEHLDQLAVSASVTRQKMREFATEIINRYKDSRAIWAWEFGNEWSLAVDLPNGDEFLPSGRRRYRQYLGIGAGDESEQERMGFAKMCWGWAKGDAEFKQRVLAMDEAGGASKKVLESEASEIGAYEWERHLSGLLQAIGKVPEDLESERKGATWKTAMAIYLRKQHLVPHQWLAANLKMGKPSSVQSWVSIKQKDEKVVKWMKKLKNHGKLD